MKKIQSRKTRTFTLIGVFLFCMTMTILAGCNSRTSSQQDADLVIEFDGVVKNEDENKSLAFDLDYLGQHKRNSLKCSPLTLSIIDDKENYHFRIPLVLKPIEEIGHGWSSEHGDSFDDKKSSYTFMLKLEESSKTHMVIRFVFHRSENEMSKTDIEETIRIEVGSTGSKRLNQTSSIKWDFGGSED